MELDEAIEKEPASGIRAEGGAGGWGAGSAPSLLPCCLPSSRLHEVPGATGCTGRIWLAAVASAS